jgi:hypothetical protein
MTANWRNELKADPIAAMLSSTDEALLYFVRRDLLEEDPGSVSQLWDLPGALKPLNKQQPAGCWDRPQSQKKHPDINYQLIETWKVFRFLVEKYGFTREHPAAARAAEFILSCQSKEGDIRGFLANQYATYYTGALLGLLVKAGYEGDPRLEKGMQWLLSMRQDDGGWSVPLITLDLDSKIIYRLSSQYAAPLPPDRTRPFSHNWTGMVLRAFAAHSGYRGSEEARAVARLLKSRFFQPDVYTSYQDANYWLRFEYPFWWNNLVSALDAVTLIDPVRDQDLDQALEWLISHQEPDGMWKTTYVPGKEQDNARTRELRPWISLAICRVLTRVIA